MVRNMISACIIWMTLLPAISVSSEPKNILDENPGVWMSIKSSKDVSTYYRWVTSETGSKFRERKGIIYSECSMNEAIHYVTNADLAKKWMNNLDENYNLKTININEWYTYTLFDIPWPLNKRDMVSLYKIYSDSIRKTTTIVITSMDQYVPLKPGIARIINYKAIWNIVEHGKLVQITFHISANNPPEFPRYIQDPLIDRVFHNNLVRLKDLLAMDN
jgi:hypothetical protein